MTERKRDSTSKSTESPLGDFRTDITDADVESHYKSLIQPNNVYANNANQTKHEIRALMDAHYHLSETNRKQESKIRELAKEVDELKEALSNARKNDRPENYERKPVNADEPSSFENNQRETLETSESSQHEKSYSISDISADYNESRQTREERRNNNIETRIDSMFEAIVKVTKQYEILKAENRDAFQTIRQNQREMNEDLQMNISRVNELFPQESFETSLAKLHKRDSI
ncbi:Oidioi.mRNA.OKI2018_I69.chr2.g8262.t1.cds [Oikopleura dioica]|uniref:Oidioi.mRNA.OKI2018_I69.chr2.g8262.t1.cds n=1 Tax=Oikopleura dioica TaxID=34765 RepID=A0ABN7T972_OIKDI|nr:Oidioi.mRNA.OKI2018_I69.chr2.g8262.t1.cds [Oikopleura dioica]